MVCKHGYDIQPVDDGVDFCIDCMKEALSGPRYVVPSDLKTVDEFSEWLDNLGDPDGE